MKDYLLTIDKGNTNSKLRLYKTQDGDVRELETNSLQEFLKQNDLDELNTDVIFSNVSGNLEGIPYFPSIDVSTYLSENRFFDMLIDYTQTIGIDRVTQAYYIYKNKVLDTPVMLIDAGTFITIDIISKEGLIGGLILPGIKLLLASYQEGSQLEQYTVSEFKDSIQMLGDTHLAHNTKDAILYGVQNLINSTVNNLINEFSCDDLHLTGGDSEVVSKLLNKEADKELIFKALYYIYKKESLH